MDKSAPAVRQWLVAVLLGEELSPVPFEFDEIVSHAGDEGVLALLASVVARMPEHEGTPGLRAELYAVLRQETIRELGRLVQMRHALTALTDAGIPSLVLKGGALAYWLYSAPAQRARCDLDLLVADREQANLAVKVLSAVGYWVVADAGVDESAEFEVALVRHLNAGNAHTIDLHWQLVNHARLARGFSFGELQDRSISVPDLHLHARALGRVHALAHALLHRITNFPTGKHDRLIWLYDIHLLVGGYSGEDWLDFLGVCREKRIASPCLDGLRASRKVFRTAIPEGVEMTLEQQERSETWRLEALDQGGMDRAHLAALPWRGKAAWLWRKLFPSPEFMRYRYGAGGAFGLMGAYLGRWWIGLKRGLGQ